jgi:virginiamycin B lyase
MRASHVVVAIIALAGCSDDRASPDTRSTESPVRVPTTTANPATTLVPTTEPTVPPTTAAPATTVPPTTAGVVTTVAATTAPRTTFTVETFPVPAGSGPHDVSPALDGGVWFTAQDSGHLGLLNPVTGESRMFALGDGSRPHGVITATDGAAWVTDGGRNSIIRVDPVTGGVTEHPLPAEAADANLNTATFEADGSLWFTGQNGWYGRVALDGTVSVYPAPEGPGPYGITTTPTGDVYYASLAGSYVGRIDRSTGAATVLEPPVPDQGSRRVWSDAGGRIWVSGWDSGDVFVYDPETDEWRWWRLPGDDPQPYAVFVDNSDAVWLSDFGANALVRFDPATETFVSVALPDADAEVRQLHGRPGELWGAESSADKLVLVRL